MATKFQQLRSEGCCACLSKYQTEIHHIKTRGSGGTDHPKNLLPLCAHCHTQAGYAWHRNRSKFLVRFPHVWERMQKQGWHMFNGKLIPPREALSKSSLSYQDFLKQQTDLTGADLPQRQKEKNGEPQ